MTEEAVSVLRETRGHVEVEWEILNFMNLPHPKGKRIESPTFLLGDASWNLWIYPKGDMTTDTVAWVALFLSRKHGSGEHSVSYSLGLKVGGSKLKESTRNNTFKDEHKDQGLGMPKFFERSALLDFLKQQASSDSSIMVTCTARLLDGRWEDVASQTSCSEGIENLSKHFGKLFLSGQRADAKLIVGEREFDVHKFVLGARSPVFDAMFQHEMTETNTGVVKIPDMDPEVVEELLIFLYTGNVDKIAFKNAQDLYKCADKYDLCDLKTECILRMASELSVDTVLDVLLLSATHEETELFNNATKYFLKRMGKIFTTDKWKTFMVENTSLANELLIKMSKKVGNID